MFQVAGFFTLWDAAWERYVPSALLPVQVQVEDMGVEDSMEYIAIITFRIADGARFASLEIFHDQIVCKTKSHSTSWAG